MYSAHRGIVVIGRNVIGRVKVFHQFPPYFFRITEGNPNNFILRLGRLPQTSEGHLREVLIIIIIFLQYKPETKYHLSSVLHI